MSHQQTIASVCPLNQDPRFTLYLLDLDNTVWYGNYQRHGYLFARLQYYLSKQLPPTTEVVVPEQELQKNWRKYTGLLHLTAPEQLTYFLTEAWQNDHSLWSSPLQQTKLYTEWSEWMDRDYWRLVNNPELLWIADDQANIGKKVTVVPGFERFFDQLVLLKQHYPTTRVVAISLNLTEISEQILSKLKVRTLFDEVYGVTWQDGHISKPDLIEKCLDADKTERSSALMIGDSCGDIQAGKTAGVATAAIATGPTSFDELKKTEPDYCWLSWPTSQSEYSQLLYKHA